MRNSNNIFAGNSQSVNEMPLGFDTPENFLGIHIGKNSKAKATARVDRKAARTENIRSKAQSRLILAQQGTQQTTGVGQAAAGVGGLITAFLGGGRTPSRSGDDTISAPAPTGQILTPSILSTVNDNNPQGKPLVVGNDAVNAAGNGLFNNTAYTTPTGQAAAPLVGGGEMPSMNQGIPLNTPTPDSLKKYLPYALGAVALYFIMKHK